MHTGINGNRRSFKFGGQWLNIWDWSNRQIDQHLDGSDALLDDVGRHEWTLAEYSVKKEAVNLHRQLNAKTEQSSEWHSHILQFLPSFGPWRKKLATVYTNVYTIVIIALTFHQSNVRCSYMCICAYDKKEKKKWNNGKRIFLIEHKRYKLNTYG